MGSTIGLEATDTRLTLDWTDIIVTLEDARRIHRNDTGRTFGGFTMHAAAGVHERAAELVSALAPLGARIADLGAGSGAFSHRLLERGYDVVAVDKDVGDIRGIEAIEADLCDEMPEKLGRGSIDFAVALEVIEHLDDPISFLKGVREILRSGGGILISTPNVLHPYSRLKFLVKGSFWMFDENSYWDIGHGTPLPAWLLSQHLRYAGFSETRIGYGGRFEEPGIKGWIMQALSKFTKPGSADLGRSGHSMTLFAFGKRT